MPPLPPDDAASATPGRLSRELVGLVRAVASAEAEREARVERKLAELDEKLAELQRVRTLIAGGASHREARLRALEDMVEAMAAERSRMLTPRPLDLPKESRFDPSVVDMHPRDREPTS